VAVGYRSRLKIILNPDVQLIDEVVATAYAGEQKQKDLVGSYEQVEGDELLPQRPIESFDKMLEGQVAGVQVELNTGSQKPKEINSKPFSTPFPPGLVP
jgi:hypothetical protein